jgi:glycerophosphoryl diester phosphodiesterase
VPAPVPASPNLARHPDRPVVVAHRGASAYAPENTLASYREALARGAVVGETDVHVAADGHVVVMHDPTLDRTTNQKGPIAELGWDAIRTADAGSWFGTGFAGEPVPDLGALLDLTRGRMVLCVELKAGAGVVERVRAAIDERAMRGDVIVFSFNPDFVRDSRAAMTDVPALLLASPSGEPRAYTGEEVALALSVGANAIGFSHRLGSAELVAGAHAAGLPVFVWTVDEEADVAKVRAWGVDGIISNAPDRVDDWLGPRVTPAA